ncbi:MAG TPA: hypothetical protein VLQ48_01050 [Chloroflexia bacterium]|nr:hypothetical protein [Chloroflexia bacterium]
MYKQWRVIVAVVCLLAVGLAGISVWAGVGPVAQLFGTASVGVVRPSDLPACGPAWRPVQAAAGGAAYNELHAVTAVSPTLAWAAGIYGGEQYALTLIERWDGTRWGEVESPSIPDFSNHLYGIAALSGSDAWIVGASHQGTGLWKTLAIHWDGVKWSITPTPDTGSINSLNAAAALSTNEVWAVGDVTTSARTGGSQVLVVRWDGRAWNVVDTGITTQNGTLGSIAAIAPDDIWAAGSFADKSGTVLQPLFLHWDGKSWRQVSATDLSGGTIWGMSARSSDDIWAVGSFGALTAAFHWDGTAWKRVPTPNPGDGKGNNSLNAVTVVSAHEVWAVGSYSEGGVDRSLALRWDGNAWTQTPAPSLGDYSDTLNAITQVPGSQGEMWAVGSTIADRSGDNLPVVLHYSDPCGAK